jgi:hypothetical protein
MPDRAVRGRAVAEGVRLDGETFVEPHYTLRTDLQRVAPEQFLAEQLVSQAVEWRKVPGYRVACPTKGHEWHRVSAALLTVTISAGIHDTDVGRVVPPW